SFVFTLCSLLLNPFSNLRNPINQINHSSDNLVVSYQLSGWRHLLSVAEVLEAKLSKPFINLKDRVISFCPCSLLLTLCSLFLFQKKEQEKKTDFPSIFLALKLFSFGC
ncbi:hypothetical protein, partial [Daejeonella sp.]|uniref:hypothetical protein n=1 Tax=Daejeonella sp. TaxID=2805397 RepID=UPI0025C25E5A